MSPVLTQFGVASQSAIDASTVGGWEPALGQLKTGAHLRDSMLLLQILIMI